MNKKKIIIICVICIILLFDVFFYTYIYNNAERIQYKIWYMIGDILDKDMARDLGDGDDYSIIYYGLGLFQINHHSDGKSLEFCKDKISMSQNALTLLSKVHFHIFSDDKLFVVSRDGFAIVDADNTCRMFIKDGYKGKLYKNIKEVKYIDDYNLFSEEERAVFNLIK